jgi:hypothetical protein
MPDDSETRNALELEPDTTQDLQRYMEACNETMAMIVNIITQARHAPNTAVSDSAPILSV